MTELIQSIELDIDERMSAIYRIERIFFTGRFDFNQEEKDIVLVHTIPMIYSLWEGYVNRVFSLYINWLNQQDLAYDTLADDIVILSIEKQFKQFKQYPVKTGQKRHFMDRIKSFFNSELAFNISSEVNTESNVGFAVLNRLLETYSLAKFPEYYEPYKHPNNSLKDEMSNFLDYRNGVVHGNVVGATGTIDQSVFKRYKDLVSFLMYDVKDRIVSGAKNSTYLK